MIRPSRELVDAVAKQLSETAVRDTDLKETDEFKIWNKTQLVCHLVPCRRNSDNVYGLYDLMQRKFYTSATNYAYTGG